MLQWIENLTYKTPPGRNIASTSRISLPNLDASIFENASTFTTGSNCEKNWGEFWGWQLGELCPSSFDPPMVNDLTPPTHGENWVGEVSDQVAMDLFIVLPPRA